MINDGVVGTASKKCRGSHRSLGVALVALLVFGAFFNVAGDSSDALAGPASANPTRQGALQIAAPNAFTANVCGAGGCRPCKQPIPECNPVHFGNTSAVGGIMNQVWNSHLGGAYVAHIGLQEVCGNQIAAFHPWLLTYVNGTYVGGAHWQISGPEGDDACGGLGRGPYGIASFVFGYNGQRSSQAAALFRRSFSSLAMKPAATYASTDTPAASTGAVQHI